MITREPAAPTESSRHGGPSHPHYKTPNPNKCTHNLRAISTKIEIISITIGVLSENSSDSSSGRRPMSKSDEFSESTPIWRGPRFLKIFFKICMV